MKTTIRLLKLVKVSLPIFVIGILIALIASFMQRYSILYIQQIIDLVITPINLNTIFDRFLLGQIATQYLLLLVTSVVLSYIGSLLLASSSVKISMYLRNRCFYVMNKLPISYFDNESAGKIASKIVDDTEKLRQSFYLGILYNMANFTIQLLVIAVISYQINPYLLIFYALLIPFYLFTSRYYNKSTAKPVKQLFEIQSNQNSLINETIMGNEIIKSFHKEDFIEKQYSENALKIYDLQLVWLKFDVFFSWSIQELFKQFSSAFVIAVVAYSIFGLRLEISVGMLFIYIKYSEEFVSGLAHFLRLLPGVRRSLTAGMRVLSFLDNEVEKDGQNELQINEGNVEFKQVNFAYVEDKAVLKNVSFQAKKGQTIALVGHTGSGKTSIMNLLFRFYDPQSGQILIDGQDISLCKRESVRKEMGIVLQDPYLFKGTIASNVAMDNPNITEEIILDAIKKVGADRFVTKLKDGIYHQVKEKGSSFSSGERQLLSFARTIAFNPKILILDEATSHIDSETESFIQEAMDVVKKGRTTFIIAHRLSTIQNADLILVLDQGEIKEMGTHQELIQKPNSLYAEMSTMQKVVN